MLKVTKSKNLQHIWAKCGQHHYADCGVIKIGGGKKSRKTKSALYALARNKERFFRLPPT